MSLPEESRKITPEWEEWLALDCWTLAEAACLLHGFAPEMRGIEYTATRSSQSVKDLARKCRNTELIISRSLRAGTVTAMTRMHGIDDPNDPQFRPTEVVRWAMKKRYKIPDEMKHLTSNNHAKKDVVDEKSATQEEIRMSKTKIGEGSLQNPPNLGDSEYWSGFGETIQDAIDTYPGWSEEQRLIQKTGNLNEWLTKSMKLTTREAEITKKVLSDLFGL